MKKWVPQDAECGKTAKRRHESCRGMPTDSFSPKEASGRRGKVACMKPRRLGTPGLLVGPLSATTGARPKTASCFGPKKPRAAGARQLLKEKDPQASLRGLLDTERLSMRISSLVAARFQKGWPQSLQLTNAPRHANACFQLARGRFG